MQDSFSQPQVLPTPTDNGTAQKSTLAPFIIAIATLLIIVAVIVTFVLLNKKSGNQTSNNMPALVEDQIVFGYKDKYFTTTNWLSDTIKDAAKSFKLYRFDADEEEEVTNIEAYLVEKVATDSGLLYRDHNGANGLKPKVFVLSPYLDETVTRGVDSIEDTKLSLSILCLANDFDFSLDGHTLTCNKSTNQELEKLFGEIPDAVEPEFGLPTSRLIYKNHVIEIFYLGDAMSGINILPLSEEEKRALAAEKTKKEFMAANPNLFKDKSESEYVKLIFEKKEFVFSGNFGWDIVHFSESGCTLNLLDAELNKKEDNVDIFSLLDRSVKANEKVIIGARCIDSKERERYFFIFGYSETGKEKTNKELSSYFETHFLGLPTGTFWVDDYYIPIGTQGLTSVDYIFTGLEKVHTGRFNTFGYRYKGFDITASLSERILLSAGVYKAGYLDSRQ